MYELLPLEMLPSGHWADVADIYGEKTWIGRLAELGISIGSRLRVVQGGSPCLLQVGETRLSLRNENDMQILVRPLPITG